MLQNNEQKYITYSNNIFILGANKEKKVGNPEESCLGPTPTP